MAGDQEEGLKHLAELVVDAYIQRDEQFVPNFGNAEAVMYLGQPSSNGSGECPAILSFWYEKSDYEEVTTVEEQE
jgi:hypothetical protein